MRISTPNEHSYKIYRSTIVVPYEPKAPEQIGLGNCTRAGSNISESCSQTKIPDHLKDLYERSITCLESEQLK